MNPCQQTLFYIDGLLERGRTAHGSLQAPDCRCPSCREAYEAVRRLIMYKEVCIEAAGVDTWDWAAMANAIVGKARQPVVAKRSTTGVPTNLLAEQSDQKPKLSACQEWVSELVYNVDNVVSAVDFFMRRRRKRCQQTLSY